MTLDFRLEDLRNDLTIAIGNLDEDGKVTIVDITRNET
jgi:hypothetical protein